MIRLLSTLITSIFAVGCSHKPEEVWIDVRTQEEWDSGHLEYAHHIPHEEIAARIAEVTDKKDAVIHLYCRSGGRAGRAKTALEEIGFTQVFNDGGYEDLKKKDEAKAGK
jgi:phage shock protein E